MRSVRGLALVLNLRYILSAAIQSVLLLCMTDFDMSVCWMCHLHLMHFAPILAPIASVPLPHSTQQPICSLHFTVDEQFLVDALVFESYLSIFFTVCTCMNSTSHGMCVCVCVMPFTDRK